MKELMKTLGFSIVLILAFNAVTYVLPQMEGAAPEETEVDVGSLNIESFVAMGEELYQGKGTCSLCHNELDAHLIFLPSMSGKYLWIDWPTIAIRETLSIQKATCASL